MIEHSKLSASRYKIMYILKCVQNFPFSSLNFQTIKESDLVGNISGLLKTAVGCVLSKIGDIQRHQKEY